MTARISSNESSNHQHRCGRHVALPAVPPWDLRLSLWHSLSRHATGLDRASVIQHASYLCVMIGFRFSCTTTMSDHYESLHEFINRCWVPIIYLRSRFLYAFGNTTMEDFLEDFEVFQPDVDILQIGAGDIRHLLKTVGGLKTRPKSAGRPTTMR